MPWGTRIGGNFGERRVGWIRGAEEKSALGNDGLREAVGGTGFLTGSIGTSRNGNASNKTEKEKNAKNLELRGGGELVCLTNSTREEQHFRTDWKRVRGNLESPHGSKGIFRRAAPRRKIRFCEFSDQKKRDCNGTRTGDLGMPARRHIVEGSSGA